MFDKYELEIIERALRVVTDRMRASKFTGESDPHFKKCEALREKVKGMVKA